MSHFFSETETESVRKERVRTFIQSNETERNQDDEEEEIQMERQLTEILEVPSNDLEFYLVEVYTGDKALAGSSRKVFIQLYGEKDMTDVMPLHVINKDKQLFKRNRIDVFHLIAPNIGTLTKIKIICSGKPGSSWFLETVVVRALGRAYRIQVGKWLRGHEAIEGNLEYIGDKCVTMGTGRVLMGPLLKLRGVSNNRWQISVLEVTENVRRLHPIIYRSSRTSFRSTLRSPRPKCIHAVGNIAMWRWDFDIELFEEGQTIDYTVPDGRNFTFVVPGIRENPRILFGSCNDRASPVKMESLTLKNAMWHYIQKIQNLNPHSETLGHLSQYDAVMTPDKKFHLMILGGDQIYADRVFDASHGLRLWNGKPYHEKIVDKSCNTQMREEIEAYYHRLYISAFSQDMIAQQYAQIPSIMIWDDHDIFDGWGSLNPEILKCQVYQEVFGIAKKFFYLFQQQGDLTSVINPRSPDGPFNQGYHLTGTTSVLVMDLRSERSMMSHNQGNVLTPQTWTCVEQWMKSTQDLDVGQLFVISSVPVIYPHHNYFDKMLDILDHDLLDDVRDHWPAIIHYQELERLLRLLFEFKRVTDSTVTILAGDVHLGAFGWIEDSLDGSVIDQFISSGFVAKPPPNFARKLMRAMHQKFRIAHYKMRMGRLPNRQYILPTQNCLCLYPVQNSENDVQYTAVWMGLPKIDPVVHKDGIKVTNLPPPVLLKRPVV